MIRTSDSAARPLLIEHQIAVATYDIDSAGHVSNISYLRWLEDMRLRLFDTYFPLENFIRQGIQPVLASTRIEYRRPIHLFDKPKGIMWVSRMGNASLTIRAEIYVDGALTTTAEHVGVFVDQANQRPVRLPNVCIERFRQSLSEQT